MGARTRGSGESLDDEQGLLTTGGAARVLGTSRQHIVDLCERGDLAFVTAGTHRRVARVDIEAVAARTRRLTRDQQRSLWLNYAVAGKLVADPDGVLGKARRNLANLRSVHARGQAAYWLAEWEEILVGPIEGVLDVLTSLTPRARDLRQNSPFAGVLTERERQQILDAFRRSREAAR
jgi:excisionase family DNA binding protein